MLKLARKAGHPVSLAVLLAFSVPAYGAPGMPAARGRAPVSADKPLLDTLKVRTLYLDGDFDPAIILLERSLRSGGPFAHADSVFIFKHLGVMYAARNEARERGKYYMHQLLAVEPTARIMDMYASDMIYMIFRNIQEEFEIARRAGASPSPPQPASGQGTRLETAGGPTPPTASRPVAGVKASQRDGRRKVLIWLGASGVMAGAGLAAYLILAGEREPRVVEHHVSGGVPE